ncbi:CYTH domain-containing protein [Streptococcus halichoeri]|uniref:CYTH domain-containing protein n=1 Tax=Streptococcus halichoeri TaxID=254785 RepID=UPI0013568242|nr:CYTH domain-containing protein [Streptococcus halichoeri]
MTELEIEYKTLLSYQNYVKILKQMIAISPVTQVNHYFDTSDFQLKSHKMSLRIRTFTDHAELTLKVPETVGNREYNLALTSDQAKTILASNQLPPSEIAALIQESGIALDRIACFGALTTVRREVQTSIGKMALDLNTYLGKTDYELELEVSDPEQGKKDFDAFLQENQLPFIFAKSKVARFSQALAQK